MPNLKIIPNLDSDIYIDDDFVVNAPKDTITKVALEKGEYLVEVISKLHKDLRIKQIIFIEYDKVLSIDLVGILKQSPNIINSIEIIPHLNEEGLWGYSTKECDIMMIPHEYQEAQAFHDGFAIVKKGKYGVIDQLGNRIVAFIYQSITEAGFTINDDEFVLLGFNVKDDNGDGYITKRGDLIIQDYFECCIPSLNYVWCVKSNNNELYSNTGELLLTAKEIWSMGKPFGAPPFLVKKNEKIGVLDHELQTIVPFDFDEHVSCYEDNYYGYFFSKEENLQVINSWETKHFSIRYKLIFPEYDCESRSPLSALYIIFYSRYELIDPDNDHMEFEREEVIIDQSCTIISEEGNKMDVDNAHPIGEGKIAFMVNGKWGVIDKRLNVLCEPTFNEIGSFYYRTALVKIGNERGVINSDGEVIIPCIYKIIYNDCDDYPSGYESAQYITVVDQEGNMGVFDRDGNTIIPVKPGQIINFDGSGNIITSFK